MVETDRDEEDIELVVPPIFENCIRVLDAGEQVIAKGEAEKDETQEKKKKFYDIGSVCGSNFFNFLVENITE